MQHDPSDQLVHVAPAKTVSRRTMISLTARLAAGVALGAVASAHTVQRAAAQDEIILTAAASEVGAKPGSAYAQGAAAYAAGDQDTGATTQAGIFPAGAAANAAGDQDTGATTQAGIFPAGAGGTESGPPGTRGGGH
jgi:hypothetical protein